MNQENLHTQLWGTLYMNSGTTQHQHRVASLPQVPNSSSSFFTLLAQQRTGWGAVRMLSQCLKTLPASAEPCPHSKLKPVEFLKITLLYNRWSLSLITGLLLPYNAMVITDKSGCPVTPTQFKAHLNPTPFSPSKVNLCSCLVYAPSCPEWKKPAFLFNLLTQLYHQRSATYPRTKLSFRRLWFEQHIPALIHGAAGLQSSTPSRNKSIVLWMKPNINIMDFFSTQQNNESLF